MAKPTNLALWATNVNYPATADPIKVEPGAGVKAAGWAPQQRPPAQWWNWWMNAVYLWMVWLDAFESTAHTWTAAQVFAVEVNFAGIVNFNGTDLQTSFTNGFQSSGPGHFYGAVDIAGVLTAGVTNFSGLVTGTKTAQFTGGAGLAGIVGIGGAGTSYGVGGVGSGAGPGGTFTGGPTGVGVEGIAGANANGVTGLGGAVTGHGVLGSSIVAGYFGLKGTGVGGGVRGEATGGSNASGGTFAGDGSGAGVQATGGATGYGIILTGNATRSPLRISVLAAVPAVGVLGDMYVDLNGVLWIYDATAAWVKVGLQT